MNRQIIAIRRFVLHDKGQEREAFLELFSPYSFTDTGDDYRCAFRVSGFGDEKVRYADGVDGIQAILLALEVAAIYIRATAEEQTIAVRWDVDDSLGLPGAPL